ncbi:MAG: Peptidase M50 [Candidatus Daviesbacteria bacterium GW2011_GWA1_42_6]|uniref:Peptidase M50 n=1 Tax=Candidatus Daviesbacteria bacterium GW2011_GWA1_42_6 TaxID=1618420 RepID=A0A0G1DNV8_9BACT|nr:MAG: Peptidase M50 [Candidatus Daviesbacteria bacterium GW2011_GWA1_42_6]
MQAEVLAVGIIILLFSVILHEVMHGWAALQFGDHTAERAGRLTLNPLPHIDPIGTILVPAVLILPAVFLGTSPGFIIGWAKPVPVNPLNFRDFRRGELLVSAAGVLINFGLAIAAALIFHLVKGSGNLPIQSLLLFTININLILGVFNSLPIPPLDGSKMVLSFLPPKLAAQYQSLEKYGLLILLFLLFFPFGPVSPLGVILGFFLNLFRTILGV